MPDGFAVVSPAKRRHFFLYNTFGRAIVAQICARHALAGTVTTPEIAFYKSSKQYSTAKIVLLAYSTGSREHIYSSGDMVGRAHDNYFHIFFVPLRKTDVPEMEKKKK